MYHLDFIHINNNEKINEYNKTLNHFKKKNPHYSLEYYNFSFENNLNYFVLTKDKTPIILLPIYLNKVESHILNNEEYYDAISPYGYSGPLFDEDVRELDLTFFWNEVDNYYKKNNIITEFIRFNLDSNYKNYSGHLIPSLNNVNGKIQDFESMWNNFKQKVRNNYRKAEASNLKIVINSKTKTLEDISTFYDIYIKTMKRNKATNNYFYSEKYFQDFIYINQDNTVLAIVYKDELPISVELLICNNNDLYSYLGGTLSEYFKYRPNDFLKIGVLKWTIINKKTHYILGGGRRNEDALYQYKKAFFPKDEDIIFYTGRKIINKEVYNNLINKTGIENTITENLITNPDVFFPFYKSK